MYAEEYTTRNGATRFCPVIEAEESLYDLDDSLIGFCVGCGEEADRVDPDSRRVQCDSCGEHLVFGFAELIVMGIFRMEEGGEE